MGSVKDLIFNEKIADRLNISGYPINKILELYTPPTLMEFGNGCWYVGGTFSVKDLKEQIPSRTIKNKPEALTLMTGMGFEYIANKHPDINTCYLGILDHDGNVVDVTTLLDRGELSNIIVMKLAHVPETYSNGDLKKYREDLANGILQCGVADVESIFRKGFPLGSSTFKKIFEAAGIGEEYANLATYDEVVEGLNKIRDSLKKQLGDNSKLENVLKKAGLNVIPNPGHTLDECVYDSTTKFEIAGDRDITQEEERKFSGLSEEGYRLWTEDYFPRTANAQIQLGKERNIIQIDGKEEVVAYHRMPVVTDFVNNPDENRMMIPVEYEGEKLIIPSNKEIQRAYFKKQSVDIAIIEAKNRAEKAGDINKWKENMGDVFKEMNIDIKAVTEYSCQLMEYAIAEVANRMLGKNIFDAKPLDQWIPQFVPYASRIQNK